ncbi:aldose 1-epimerase family protein [Flavobacterium sp. 25HG05S-40]|uniref:aldose 1-epimerase family protein n=1 Tax=Flavobacterium sp. 25HG05S-40 TaxID=3458682 RepID=UPI004043AA15
MKTTLSNSKLSAVIERQGAELISLKANDTNREYIWEGNPDFWGKHAPILFPIVGTLKNNSITHLGNEYKLLRHGFAREMTFDLLKVNENEAVFSLKSNESTKAMYPFDFELQITYTLLDSELNISYKVVNQGSEIMYYSIGGHPALALPNLFETYSLQFESDESLVSYQLENDLLSDQIVLLPLEKSQLPLSYALFEKDALIFKELSSNEIHLLENEAPIIKFKFTDFPNFGIWTKQNAPFICLEPWLGYSDVLNANGEISEKEGIQRLAANSFQEYQYTIEIL